MGVPNFYSWLNKRYPLCKYPITKHHGHRVDFLYLDMNQVIYKCATNQTILKDQMIQKSMDELWTAILNYINEIIDLVDPQILIYLTFDGVAPRAKANQQRQRRFASSKSDAKIQQLLKSLDLEQQNQTFKNNQITAGTEFMQELNEQVKFFIQCKFNEDDKYNKLKVIFSGSDVPGEGEHKILEFMRNLKQQNNFNSTWSHCIYSADADLIMLSLGIHLKNISIIREECNMDNSKTQIACKRQVDKIQFELINIQIVAEYLDFEYKTVKMNIQYDRQRVIDDFLLLFFFVGNDFLPRVYCFDIKQGTVELLIETFKQFLEQCDDYLTNNGQINWKSMQLFTQLLSKFEIKAIEKRSEELKKQIKSADEFEEYKIQWQDELKILESLNLEFSNNNSAVARKLFYQIKCNLDIDTEEGKKQLDLMVQKYLEGIQFVLQYYYNKVPSWEWYYSYYYSPLCFDLYTYISKNEQQQQIQFLPSQPYEPFQQLLLILPPHNQNLLPEPFRALYNDTSLLRQPFDYYPNEYEIDPFGAIWEHQFICKVPFMNSELLQNEYSKIDKSTLNERESSRGKFGTAYLFEYEKQQPILVQSKLTSIYKDSYFTCKFVELKNNEDAAIQVISKIEVKQQQQELPVFPSLNILQINNAWLQNRKDIKLKNQKIIKFELAKKDLRFLDELEKAKDNSQQFNCYCGYPQSYYGEVAMVISKESIIFLKNYTLKDIYTLDEYRDDIINEVRNDIYEDLKDILQIKLTAKGLFVEQVNAIAIVFFYKEMIRNSDRSLNYNMTKIREEVMPLEWLSDKKLVDLQDYRLQESDLIKQKVIVLNNDQNSGVVSGSIGFAEQKVDDNHYIVNLTKQPQFTQKLQIQELKYYDLRYVSEQLQAEWEVILYIMGTVRIFIGNKKKQTEIIAEQVDIGFNATHRGRNQLVPELLRIHDAKYDAEGFEKFKQFESCELSEIMFEHLKEYKNRLPQVFEYLKNLGKDKLKSLNTIQLKQLFPEEEAQNGLNTILKHYVWLLQLPTSQYQLYNVASNSYSSQTIKQVENIKQSKNQSKTIFVPKVWILNMDKFYVPPLMSAHPEIHKLGDRVVALNNKHTNFGQYGTVVGVIDVGQIMIEIIWDKPRFGQKNLGGKCSSLRGSLVQFLDVFNLSQKWENQLLTTQGGLNQKVWTYKQEIFIPSYDKPENRKKKQKQINTTNL